MERLVHFQLERIALAILMQMQIPSQATIRIIYIQKSNEELSICARQMEYFTIALLLDYNANKNDVSVKENNCKKIKKKNSTLVFKKDI